MPVCQWVTTPASISIDITQLELLDLSSSCDGVTTLFTLPSPVQAVNALVSLRGTVRQPGTLDPLSGDYVIIGTDQIEFHNPPETNDELLVWWADTTTGIPGSNGGGGGEANTVANVGDGGIGLYKQKVGTELQFKNLNIESSKLTLTNHVPTNEVRLDVDEAYLDHTLMLNKGTNTHAQIDSHIGSTSNPHGVGIASLAGGTLAEFNQLITDATLDANTASRTPLAHTASHLYGGSDPIALQELSSGAAAVGLTLRSTGSGEWALVTAPLNNFTATVDPITTDDSTLGYAVGSFWFNVQTEGLFRAKSVDASSAVWLPMFVFSSGTAPVSGELVAFDGASGRKLKHTGGYIRDVGGGILRAQAPEFVHVQTDANQSSGNVFSTNIDASTGSKTFTLVAAASVPSRIYFIRKVDDSLNVVYVSGATINGVASIELQTQYECVLIQSVGTEWAILAHYSYATGGDVYGPSLAVPNNIAIFSDVDGKHIDDSGVALDSLLTTASSLGDLDDVTITTPVDNAVLVYDEATSTWIDESASVAFAHAIDDTSFHSGIAITTPADLEVLAYDLGSTNWINMTAAEAGLAASGHTHNHDDLDNIIVSQHRVLDDTSTSTTTLWSSSKIGDILFDYQLTLEKSAINGYASLDASGTVPVAELPAAALSSGDVVGPAVAVDNNLVSFDLTTGKLIQDSGVSASNIPTGIPVPVVEGGTGSTTATGARTELGVDPTGFVNGVRIFPPDIDDPIAISAGDMYYNTALQMDMRWDAVREKWLSVNETIMTFGHNGEVAAGVYFDGKSNITFTATNGFNLPGNGTVVAMGLARDNTTAIVIELTSNGNAIAGGSLATLLTSESSSAIDAGFTSAGGAVMGARNHQGSDVCLNLQGWARIKWSV